jgi:hypothetical protein
MYRSSFYVTTSQRFRIARFQKAFANQYRGKGVGHDDVSPVIIIVAARDKPGRGGR